MRDDFVDRAQKLYLAQLKQYQLHEDHYRDLAEAYKLDPTNIFYGMGGSIVIDDASDQKPSTYKGTEEQWLALSEDDQAAFF